MAQYYAPSGPAVGEEYFGERVLFRVEFNRDRWLNQRCVNMSCNLSVVMPLFCLNSLLYAAVGDSTRQEEFASQNVFVTDRNIHATRTINDCGCCVANTISKTIPLEKVTDILLISDCMGDTCGFSAANGMPYKVAVETASSGYNQDGVRMFELVLECLEDPEGFRAAVMGAKRAYYPGGGGMMMPPQMMMMPQPAMPAPPPGYVYALAPAAPAPQVAMAAAPATAQAPGGDSDHPAAFKSTLDLDPTAASTATASSGAGAMPVIPVAAPAVPTQVTVTNNAEMLEALQRVEASIKVGLAAIAAASANGNTAAAARPAGDVQASVQEGMALVAAASAAGAAPAAASDAAPAAAQ